MKASKKRVAEATRRAEALMTKMTLEQKVGQLSQFGRSIYGGTESYYEDHYPEGKIGSYLSISGTEKINGIQQRLIENTPHNIPAIFAYDVIHGYKTTMPTPLSQSCSWEPEVAKEGCSVAAKEAYAGGIRWTFAPMVDIARDPRWGRIMEGYGEDTYLCSKFAAASVEGFMGDEIGQEDKILACAKHFVTYGACIGGRDYNSADMSLQTLHDVYLPSFKAAFDAGCPTCMPAFNDFNGIPCTCNHYLLQKILREQFAFDGVTVSDAGAVMELIPHNVCDNERDAVKLAFNAGIDIIMAFDPYNDNIPDLVRKGEISEKKVNEACKRVLVLKFLLGLFENPYTDEKKQECFFCDEHMQVALNAAKRSMVLLENKNKTLPLKEGTKIALVGPVANDSRAVLGNWSGPCEPAHTITIKMGLETRFGADNVTYAQGCNYFDAIDNGFEDAKKAASGADVIVLAIGEHADMAGEARSMSDISIPKIQRDLLDEMKKLGKPVVVLLNSGRPIAMGNTGEIVDAMLYIGQCGTQTGNAVAEILSGDYNPSGRLSTTFPKVTGQVPCYYNALNTGRPALGNRCFEAKYQDVSIEPAYPFGYGLSYSKFMYTDFRLSKNEYKANEKIRVVFGLHNIGDCAGEEVVEFYVRDVLGTSARPMKELKYFEKVKLARGESKEISFEIDAKDLAYTNWDLKKIVEPGEFKVWLGHNSSEPATNVLSFNIVE